MTDPITDMMNRIRNAQAVDKTIVRIPLSKIKKDILNLLQRTGWVKEINVRGNRWLEIETGKKISGVKRISKPGQRIYVPAGKIKSVRDGIGMSIVSTSRGLVTDREARREKIGGELLMEIW